MALRYETVIVKGMHTDRPKMDLETVTRALIARHEKRATTALLDLSESQRQHPTEFAAVILDMKDPWARILMNAVQRIRNKENDAWMSVRLPTERVVILVAPRDLILAALPELYGPGMVDAVRRDEKSRICIFGASRGAIQVYYLNVRPWTSCDID